MSLIAEVRLESGI